MKFKYLVVIFCILTLFYQHSFAETKDLDTWPYGGIVDESRKEYTMKTPPLNFQKIADFSSVTFKEVANFPKAKFYKNGNFNRCQFDSLANFSSVLFKDEGTFHSADFHGFAAFGYSNFGGYASFTFVNFEDQAYFGAAKFDSVATFFFAKFHKEADFDISHFSNIADFGYATFNDQVNFYDTYFSDKTNFEGTKFLGSKINLASVQFVKQVDFRRARLDKIKSIFVNHNLVFPIGELYIYWDQLKGKDSLRIKLFNPPQVHSTKDSSDYKNLCGAISLANTYLDKNYRKTKSDSLTLIRSKDTLLVLQKEAKAILDSLYDAKIDSVAMEHYQRLETFYLRLRDNFLAQGDKSSADAVMYELGWQKKEIIGGFWQTLYGWVIGWGYQPWRFLFYVAIPIILIFACIWYYRYYGIIAVILSEKIEQNVLNVVKKAKTKEVVISKKIRWNIYDHGYISNDVAFLYRIWHVVYFSASILLGVRWKKQWSDVPSKQTFGYKSYILWLSIEYFIGIGLYVTFAVLAKGAQFAYIKGLLGF